MHRVLSLKDTMGLNGFDDELDFNTQLSSQWDSYCHVHSPEGLAYNGAKPTVADLEVQTTEANSLPTIDHWHARGCIAGRGVLIDFKRWIEETKGQSYHTLDGHRITVQEIEEIAKVQGVEFKPGDILLVRTGYTELLEAPTPEDFAKFAAQTLSGVHGSEETARWVWNKRISAVAGDAHAFEALPPQKPDGTTAPLSELGELDRLLPLG